MKKVIIFPTDTVYGIGTSIYNIEGINRIYSIKHRPANKPLACLCSSLKQIEEVAFVDESAKKLIEKFLPGALTIILESKPEIKGLIGYETIGVRIPNHSIAFKLLEANGPMLTTSVNDSGNAPLNEYDDICDIYSDLVDEIYDTNTTSSNKASTVVSIISGKVEILREGEISIESIEKILNE